MQKHWGTRLGREMGDHEAKGGGGLSFFFFFFFTCYFLWR